MKSLRRSFWALLGALLFTFVSLLLPNSRLLASLQTVRVIAADETVAQEVAPDTTQAPTLPESNPETSGPSDETPADETPADDAIPPEGSSANASPDSTPDAPAATEIDGTEAAAIALPDQIPENATRFQVLAAADKLYRSDQQDRAEELYRRVKDPFPERRFQNEFALIEDPTQLSSTAQHYWKEAQKQLKRKRFNQAIVPLQRLTIRAPQFIPAYKRLADALLEEDYPEEAALAMEKLVSLSPESAEITWDYIKVLEKAGMRLEASIAARQFALVYPEHIDAAKFHESADKNFRRFRRALKEEMILEGIIGLGLGYVLTGNPWATGFRAASLARLMLQGESGLGTQIANAYRKRLTMVEDPIVLDYVNGIGQQLATMMAKDRFEYEFYVVEDEELNAFALPGGKVFVNSGAMLKANSEAELAGLLGHEIAHAVLSHGFQRITKGGFLSTLTGALPFGNFISALVNSDYSRSQEQQADILGTRVLARAGYAADGLRNFMVTLKENQRRSPPAYLSTHPLPADRVRYLENLIYQNGYNRYAFEGVEKLAAVQEQLKLKEEKTEGEKAPFIEGQQDAFTEGQKDTAADVEKDANTEL